MRRLFALTTLIALLLVAVWTMYEGRPSMDGRYWGLVAKEEEWLAARLAGWGG